MKKTIITLLFLILIILLFLFLRNKNGGNNIKDLVYSYNNHKIEWKSKEEKTIIPIKFDNFGRILLKAKIDNVNIGYLLFDTGYGITNLSNKLDNYSQVSNQSNSIMDGTGEIQEQKVKILNKLSIGELSLKSFKYNSGNSYTNDFSKDSICGILGINAIKHFIWDIDMQNKKITISSQQIEYQKNTDYQEINLIERPWEYQLQLKINNSNKYATLDTGSSVILVLKDSIQISKKYNYSGNSIGIKSSFSKTKLRATYGSIKIGNYLLKDNRIWDKNINNIRNILGIPILHSFQRVILDFKKNKFILINPVETEGIYHPNSISAKNRFNYQKKNKK